MVGDVIDRGLQGGGDVFTRLDGEGGISSEVDGLRIWKRMGVN